MNEAAEDDRYNVQNAEQSMRVLEGNPWVQNKVLGVRRLEAGGLVHVRGRLRKWLIRASGPAQPIASGTSVKESRSGGRTWGEQARLEGGGRNAIGDVIPAEKGL